MKTVLKYLLCLSLLTCLSLSIPVLQTGCSTPAKTIAYNTLSATQLTVDKAYSAFWDLVVAGKVTPEQQAKVQAARAKFQAAFTLAVNAAKFNYTSPTPDAVGVLAADLVTTIQTLTK